ncbi:hypothetical protein [Actinomadura sp. KC216]|uniref:hypothetical protein n=1 Tax=Actinomadura sp. KC216 TaxID=2530370 RepID=UPI00140465EF|nr:hypothetical protein [Actinomadura sp. KC216]
MNLGKLNRDKLIEAAARRGIPVEELEKALRENKTLVARHGATHSATFFGQF